MESEVLSEWKGACAKTELFILLEQALQLASGRTLRVVAEYEGMKRRYRLDLDFFDLNLQCWDFQKVLNTN